MMAKSVCTVKKSIKVVIAVWFMSFVLASPTLIVQEHLEIGMVQTAFWCLRGGGADYGSELPSWLWPVHEIYFTIILLIIPGTIMSVAYGGIAVKLHKCMKERKVLSALKAQKSNSRLVALYKQLKTVGTLRLFYIPLRYFDF